MDFSQKIAELQEAIRQFMEIHNNPHDTSKHNALAEKLTQLDPVLKQAAPPTVTNTQEIKGSVGKGATNKAEDVKIVQALLKLTVDGDCGKKTIAAIEAFQKSIGFAKPDGKIDAGGKTWQSLKAKGTPVVTAPVTTTPVTTTPVTTTPVTTTPVTTTPVTVPSGNNVIKKSVGLGGVNDAADVVTVQKLLKDTWGYDIPTNGVVDDKTIQAIRKFQHRYAGNITSQDCKVDPGGNTWKYLIGELKPAMAKTEDGIIGGAETELEKQMADFTKAFMGIQVEVNPGEFVSVRPPYHINTGKRLDNVYAARDANPKVKKIVANLGFGGSIGKATPAQIEKFLEDCIAQSLIKDKSSQGLHDFLSKYGVSTDCSGLAIQAANFLLQGDTERSTAGESGEAVKITNTQGIQGHPAVSSPKNLRAGDMMVNYKRKGTGTYHVRIIVDMDEEGDAIAFTTVESGSSSNLGDGGDGVGQVRWKFLANKFENLQVLKGNTWATAGTSDQAYTYVRMKQLAKL